jgi:hypothetical protein
MSKFLNNVDLNGNELRNIKLQNLAVAPTTSATAGGIYYDTGSNVVKFHNGTSWVTISAGASGTYQPSDVDLTAIASLTGTAGFLKTNGSGTWTVDTNTYLTSTTGVTTVNGSSGAISNVALTTNTLAQFAATTSSQLAGVISDETGTGALVFANSPTFVSPVLGTVGAGSILTNATGLPVATGISGLGTGVATFLATPSSANLASAVTGETGTGALVFGTSPAITTSLTTASTSFDLINTAATTVNFAGAATAVNIGNAAGTVTIAGDLVVNGTTTTINSTTVTVDDINIVLGSVTTPTNSTANGGGITVAGGVDGNKTWNWVSATSSWTSSEHIDLASGKVLKIAGTQVLSATQYTGNSSTATTATNVTGGAAGSIVYQTGSATTTTLGLGTSGHVLTAGASAPVWTKKKHAETLATSATSYALTHGLGTADISVSVYEVSTGEVVYADVVNTSSTTTVYFATAPTANQYRVVILA